MMNIKESDYSLVYRYGLQNWVANFLIGINHEDCYKKFMGQIKKELNIDILLDGAIVQVFKFLRSYSDNNVLKQIVTILFKKKFIKKKQFLKCLFYFSQINDQIIQFIQRVRLQLQYSTVQIFQKIFNTNILQFCQLVKAQKFNNIKLVQIIPIIENQIFLIDKQQYIHIIHNTINNFNKINLNLNNLAITRSLQLKIVHKQKIIQQCIEIQSIFNKFQKYINCNFQPTYYGSLINGFGVVNQTDIDISLQIQLSSQYNQWFMSQFYFQCCAQKSFTNVNRIRSNLVTFFYGNYGVDVTIDNKFSVLNSKLLLKFSQSNMYIRNMGILIKMWAKKFQIIDKHRLSSYSLILMLLYYLIVTQQIFPLLKQNEQYYIKEITDISTPLLINLYEFFNYYSYDGQFFKSNRMISLDLNYDGILRENDRLFWIKDPFNKNHNPGRLRIRDKQVLFSVFQNAKKVIFNMDENEIMNLFD